MGLLGRQLGEVTKVTRVAGGYRVQNRRANRSSSFLGVNLGLDYVPNLSKSGLKPDQDDQGAQKGAKSVRATEAPESYEIMQAHETS